MSGGGGWSMEGVLTGGEYKSGWLFLFLGSGFGLLGLGVMVDWAGGIVLCLDWFSDLD